MTVPADPREALHQHNGDSVLGCPECDPAGDYIARRREALAARQDEPSPVLRVHPEFIRGYNLGIAECADEDAANPPQTREAEGAAPADYDRDALAMDLEALSVTMPVLLGSGSYSTTVSVQMLDRLYRAARTPEAQRDAERPDALDSQLLTDAINAVLRKQTTLAYAGFVYGETGAAVAREYDRLRAGQRDAEPPDRECAICGATVPEAIWTRHLENGCQPEDTATRCISDCGCAGGQPAATCPIEPSCPRCEAAQPGLRAGQRDAGNLADGPE